MSEIIPGFNFGSTEQVTNAKLAALVNQATLDPSYISGLPVDSTIGASDRIPYWRQSDATRRSITPAALSALAAASVVQTTVAQASHGFTPGQVVYRTGAGIYALAKADSTTTLNAVGIVSSVVDANNFILATNGIVSGLSGFTTGSLYYLSASSAGATTTTSPGGNGKFGKLVYVALSTTAVELMINPATTYASGNHLGNYRITLTSGLPVTSADVTGANTIYVTPYNGGNVSVYDGTSVWTTLPFPETSLALGSDSASFGYDLFGFNNSGVFAIERLAWASLTARAVALSLQDGVYVKSTDTTRRYLGSYALTGVGATEDSVANRFIYNHANKTVRKLKVTEATANWAYATASWRQANANTGNKVQVMIGLPEETLSAQVKANVGISGGGNNIAVGVGINSTTANSADLVGNMIVSSGFTPLTAFYSDILPIGLNAINWLEQGNGSSATFHSNETPNKSGLLAQIRM